MSNLGLPISALVATIDIFTKHHPTSAKEMKDKIAHLDGLNRAISILRDEKRKDELEERRKREEALK